jgi:predicted RNase H-like HicB family nuclease
MAIFIALVRGAAEAGYIASFPDFPGCAVGAPSVELVIGKAREALLAHIERLLEANQKLCVPTPADAIERGDALLLAAIEVPDDLAIAPLNLAISAISALSLARIESFARRHGLTHSALFIEAVNRWAMQETMPRERRAETSEGPTLFDFGNPLEISVEPITAPATAQDETATPAPSPTEKAEDNIQCNVDDITAELVRLLEERSEPQPTNASAGEGATAPFRK